MSRWIMFCSWRYSKPIIIHAMKNSLLRIISTCLYFCKPRPIADMIPQITPRHQIHDQIQYLPILKSILHIDNKRIINPLQQILLIHNTLYTLLRHDPTIVLSSYSDLSISFRAKNCRVFLCSTFHTLPKPPFPTM